MDDCTLDQVVAAEAAKIREGWTEAERIRRLRNQEGHRNDSCRVLAGWLLLSGSPEFSGPVVRRGYYGFSKGI